MDAVNGITSYQSPEPAINRAARVQLTLVFIMALITVNKLNEKVNICQPENGALGAVVAI
jgi:hypothetical protein